MSAEASGITKPVAENQSPRQAPERVLAIIRVPTDGTALVFEGPVQAFRNVYEPRIIEDVQPKPAKSSGTLSARDQKKTCPVDAELIIRSCSWPMDSRDGTVHLCDSQRVGPSSRAPVLHNLPYKITHGCGLEEDAAD